MHSSFGSATFLQQNLPGKSIPNFPWEKSHWHNKQQKEKRKKVRARERTVVSQASTGTVSKALLEKLPRDGVKRVWAFPNAQILP